MGKFLAVLLFLYSAFSFALFSDRLCRALEIPSSARTQELSRYEAARIIGLKAEANIETFRPQVGLSVSERGQAGEAGEVIVRVLSDNPSNEIFVLGEFNGWQKREEEKLHAVPGTPYFEGKVRGLRHGMEYRLSVNGQEVIDPAATLFTTPEYSERFKPGTTPYFNSVFWDFDRENGYRLQSGAVDLRLKPVIVAETEVWVLASKWWKDGHQGPTRPAETYSFIAQSGVIERIKDMGYNAIEFLPFNASVDGPEWQKRYQVFGNFGPDSRFGTPDEFAQMIDAFNRNGIAVIMDAVVGHFPYKGNENLRSLSQAGIHQWKKADGRLLFAGSSSDGSPKLSPWDTYRYDYLNPYVRRFLIDGIITMFQRYGISGIRFDNLDGIRFEPGGWDFLRELVTEVRRYRPEAVLIGEMFFPENRVFSPVAEGGLGITMRTHSNLFDFFKDHLQGTTEAVPMSDLREAIRGPWGWGELPRIQYLTNHDEAANQRGGATGSYVSTLLKGGDWYHVERKIRAFNSLALVSGMAYMDMPQLRLLQEGNFNTNSPLDWSLLQHESQKQNFYYFSHLSWMIKDNEAFAFHNLHPNVENHTDYDNRVISLLRINFKTGKKYLAVINLGHREFPEGYRVGIEGDGNYKVISDSERSDYGGNHRLAQATDNRTLGAEGVTAQGKDHSINLPYLAPYHAVLLEQQ